MSATRRSARPLSRRRRERRLTAEAQVSQSAVFSGARRVRGPAPGGRAWVRSREVFRDAVCARIVLRVMRWVGKLREQAERVSQDGAWRGRHRPSHIARVGVLLPIPPGALGRLKPGEPKLPPTGGRVARAALSATIPQAFAHPLVHARATKSAINPGWAGTVSRVAAVARLARVAALK